MKRILSFDGGGIRGIISLEIIREIERIFRTERGDPSLVLSDEFQFFAGTSTGALIATGLSWGMSVDDIETLYFNHGAELFNREPWHRRWKSKYNAESIGRFFLRLFSEDGNGENPALLGSKKLKTLLMIVIRNASTGSPWPVTNNINAIYNQPNLLDCNLNIPLWQLLRASTAAPTYFPPQPIKIGDRIDLFVDGGVTPYNNPALIAALTAIMPCYNLKWPTGVDNIQVVSIGTGSMRTRFPAKTAQRIHLFDQLDHFIPAIMGATSSNQDLLCRVLGNCVYGDEIDSEIGDLVGSSVTQSTKKLFSYVRYNIRFDAAESMQIASSQNKLDNLNLLPILKEVGQEYADNKVKRKDII
ncbi:MAG: hypothetical protein VR73_16040 [Gammaproteobacteria bacterium BRH_c0]|nr:MAG: hypothetical protein VR73_16040 [Gammaproteobacteria bacterium BRH_c0]